MARQAGTIESYNSIFETISNATGIVYDVSCVAIESNNQDRIFADYANANYRLRAGSRALNMGENIPHVNGEEIFLEDYTDMDFTARIKDCTVDAGAYEYDNTENIAPDANRIYYVTEVGGGAGQRFFARQCRVRNEVASRADPCGTAGRHHRADLYRAGG